MSDPNRICYICGFDLDTEPPAERQEWPDVFCPCCNFEYDADDQENDSMNRYRKEWIKEGLKFAFKLYNTGYNWTYENAMKQLENLKLVDIKNCETAAKTNANYSIKLNKEEIEKAWGKARNVRR